MSSSKSIALNIYKKYSFLKPIYLFYNIYIRNFKFLKNGSQFGEEKSLNKLLKNRNKGTYLDLTSCINNGAHLNKIVDLIAPRIPPG